MSETNLTTIKKIADFFFTKILIGLLVVGGLVAFAEWALRPLLASAQLSIYVQDLIVGITEALLALFSYVLLFQWYEKRRIRELSTGFLWKEAALGFLTGLSLQSLFILVIYGAADYSVIRVNPASFLLPAFTTALTAGFVAEIMIRGIAFRLIEEKMGTAITLVIFALLFAALHAGKNATILSVLSTAIQAGVLLSSSYILTRRLWFPIFLHFAWDFAEPGIYGGINPGNSVGLSLFTSKISGPQFLTGGQLGPQNSLQSVIGCLAVSLLFLWIAKRRNNFIKPSWKNKLQ